MMPRMSEAKVAGSLSRIREKLLKKLKSLGIRLRLAEEHLEEAKRALNAGAIVAAIHEAQLSP